MSKTNLTQHRNFFLGLREHFSPSFSSSYQSGHYGSADFEFPELSNLIMIEIKSFLESMNGVVSHKKIYDQVEALSSPDYIKMLWHILLVRDGHFEYEVEHANFDTELQFLYNFRKKMTFVSNYELSGLGEDEIIGNFSIAYRIRSSEEGYYYIASLLLATELSIYAQRLSEAYGVQVLNADIFYLSFTLELLQESETGDAVHSPVKKEIRYKFDLSNFHSSKTAFLAKITHTTSNILKKATGPTSIGFRGTVSSKSF